MSEATFTFRVDEDLKNEFDLVIPAGTPESSRPGRATRSMQSTFVFLPSLCGEDTDLRHYRSSQACHLCPAPIAGGIQAYPGATKPTDDRCRGKAPGFRQSLPE